MVRMGIARLRKEHPDWAWTAERGGGFGNWEYIGLRDDRRVRVYATAALCGPSDDDYVTVWQVDDGARSGTFFFWSLQECR